jgi:uncharacterized protein YbjT (DUF2867 family)
METDCRDRGSREAFKVRALSRNPDKHRELAGAVVKADLNRPETLKAAFEGAHVETFSYFQAHTYLGSDLHEQIALANKIAGSQPTRFSTWDGPISRPN